MWRVRSDDPICTKLTMMLNQSAVCGLKSEVEADTGQADARSTPLSVLSFTFWLSPPHCRLALNPELYRVESTLGLAVTVTGPRVHFGCLSPGAHSEPHGSPVHPCIRPHYKGEHPSSEHNSTCHQLAPLKLTSLTPKNTETSDGRLEQLSALSCDTKSLGGRGWRHKSNPVSHTQCPASRTNCCKRGAQRRRRSQPGRDHSPRSHGMACKLRGR
mmetsp:Transcript_4423/g.11597  ORF Transcript_4423/g.11597 Transcript_4423/m.11597 type:complete len:215 (-) Transcript_4423:675-1319(-)